MATSVAPDLTSAAPAAAATAQNGYLPMTDAFNRPASSDQLAPSSPDTSESECNAAGPMRPPPRVDSTYCFWYEEGLRRLRELLEKFVNAKRKADVDLLVHKWKELFFTSKGALTADASTMICDRMQSQSENIRLQGCKLVRAVCFANCIELVTCKSIRQGLLQILFGDTPSSEALLTIAIDACASVAIRDPSFISEILQGPDNRAPQLLRFLSKWSATVASNRKSSSGMVRGPTSNTVASRTAGTVDGSDTDTDNGTSGSDNSYVAAAAAAAATTTTTATATSGSDNPCVALLNLLSCLVRQRHALKALLSAGLGTSVASLCMGPDRSDELTMQPSNTAVSDIASPIPIHLGGAQSETSNAAAGPEASPPLKSSSPELSAVTPQLLTSVQEAALSLALHLSSHSDIRSHLLADGILPALAPVLRVAHTWGSVAHVALAPRSKEHLQSRLAKESHSGLAKDRHSAIPEAKDHHSVISAAKDRHAVISVPKDRRDGLDAAHDRHAVISVARDRHSVSPAPYDRHAVMSVAKDQQNGLEAALNIISNVAGVGPAAQQAILSSPETIMALTQLLTYNDTKVVCHTCDAISALCLRNYDVQSAIASSHVQLPTEERAVQPAIVVLSKIMATKAPTALLIRCCHVLGSLVLDHPANQTVLLAAGCVPTLISLMESDQALLNRHALACMTNLVSKNMRVQKAVIKAGGVAAVSAVIIRAAKASDGVQQMVSSSSEEDLAGASPQLRRQEKHAADLRSAAERACDMLTNLVNGFPAAKQVVVDSGALPPLVLFLSSQQMEIAAAAAATLSNVTTQKPDVQSQLSELGAIPALRNLIIRGGLRASHASEATLKALMEAEPCEGGATTAAAPECTEEALKLLPSLSAATQPMACRLVCTACHMLGSLMLNHEANKQAVLDSGVLPLLMKLLQVSYAPMVAISAARTLEILARDFPQGQDAVGELGGIRLLLPLTEAPEPSLIKAALSALISAVQGSRVAQDEMVRCGAAPILSHLLGKMRDREMVVRTVTCLKVTVEANEAAQTAFGEAGALQPFLRLIRQQEVALVELCVVAVKTLIKGHRPNQLKAATAGLIAPMAVLLDNGNPSISRSVVSAWLALGGLPAMVKLLSHNQPTVVEVAVRCIAESLAVGAVAKTAASASSPELKEKEPSAKDADVAALLQAKAPAALLNVCRTARGKGAVQAALLSIKLLACHVDGRSALVDAGAMAVLQQLMGTPAPEISRLAAAASQNLFM